MSYALNAFIVLFFYIARWRKVEILHIGLLHFGNIILSSIFKLHCINFEAIGTEHQSVKIVQEHEVPEINIDVDVANLQGYTYNNYEKLDIRQKTEKILERSKNREYFYTLLIKLFCIILQRGLRMILENPYSGQHYLVLAQNFVMPPTMIDHNRQLRGDYYRKPTAYWFVNCQPTHGRSYQKPSETKTVMTAKGSGKAGLCSEERSLISPDYARNFIADFIIGREQPEIDRQMKLFPEV